MLMLVALLIAAVAGCSSGRSDERPPVAQEKPPERVAPVATPAPSASLAVATFRGERVRECIEVTAEVIGSRPFKPAHAVALVMDDALGMTRGAGSLLADGKAGEISSAIARLNAEQVAMFDETIARELPGIAKDGSMARVDSCASLGRMPLGTCALKSDSDSISWSLVRKHFDVRDTADTDKALKACLRIGGKWLAPDKDDPAAARERIRQRALDLKKLTEER